MNPGPFACFLEIPLLQKGDGRIIRAGLNETAENNVYQGQKRVSSAVLALRSIKNEALIQTRLSFLPA